MMQTTTTLDLDLDLPLLGHDILSKQHIFFLKPPFSNLSKGGENPCSPP